MSKIVTVSQSKSEKRSGEKGEKRDSEDSIENGVPLAGCNHAEGEKSGCQDFLLFLHSLSSSNFLSLSLSSLYFSTSAPKGGLQKMSLWAGLPSPTLKVVLAKKRGGQEKGRSSKDWRV